jgi:hypothetical protein
VSLTAPGADARSWELADWLELWCLGSSQGDVALEDLTASMDLEQEFEDEDFEQDSAKKDEVTERAWNAISERRKGVEGYPFALVPDRFRLKLVAPISEAGYVYLFCLILSQEAADGILSGLLERKVAARERDLFQVCATVGAAGLVFGPAFSFGFPRPDGSGFLAKLRQIWEQFQDGRPVKRIPHGAPKQAKDDGIDVIAWKDHGDKLPSTLLLGQAGSGRDWKEKPVVSDVQRFLDTWFDEDAGGVRPRSETQTATFTPFCLDVEEGGECSFVSQEDELQATVERSRVQYRRHCIRAGQLLYRNRMPGSVARGLSFAREERVSIERLDEIQEVKAWVECYRNDLKRSLAS